MMDITQVAEALAVSETTVRRLLRAGEIPVVMVGRQYRIQPDDLQLYIQSHTQTYSVRKKTDDRN